MNRHVCCSIQALVHNLQRQTSSRDIVSAPSSLKYVCADQIWGHAEQHVILFPTTHWSLIFQEYSLRACQKYTTCFTLACISYIYTHAIRMLYTYVFYTFTLYAIHLCYTLACAIYLYILCTYICYTIMYAIHSYFIDLHILVYATHLHTE